MLAECPEKRWRRSAPAATPCWVAMHTHQLNAEVDGHIVDKGLRAGVKLVSQLHDIYVRADDASRKRINQAV